MITILKNEWTEFEQCHKNAYNVYFHIFCGFMFMTFLFLAAKPYSILGLIIYTLLLIFTLQSLWTPLIISTVIGILLYITKSIKVSITSMLLLFVLFYFLPDVSHYLSNEPSMLTLDNITHASLFINIFYLLPFSIMIVNNSYLM